MFYFKIATGFYLQNFLVPSTAAAGPSPLLFNETQVDALELIYESYTGEIAAPNLVPGIVTECLLTGQQEMNGIMPTITTTARKIFP